MTLDEAKERLNSREVQMVLHIPADFSQAVQKPGQKGQIDYLINESNPALIKSIMQGYPPV
ncbi:ABC transporter permease [Paenibacillus sp. P25]|nr:ABC transporter permease [Paenibacillus sp. P25]